MFPMASVAFKASSSNATPRQHGPRAREIAQIDGCFGQSLGLVSIAGHFDALRGQTSRMVEVPSGPVNAGQAAQCVDEAVRMVEHLGDSDPLVSHARPLIETRRARQGPAPRRSGTWRRGIPRGHNVRESGHRKQLKDPLEELVDPPVVPRHEVGGAENCEPAGPVVIKFSIPSGTMVAVCTFDQVSHVASL